MNTLTESFGKGYWKTYEEAIQREWVITNGLGGYAGMSIIDSPARKHHGLLIASLHSPVKRYLLLSALNTSLTIGDKDYDFRTYKDNNKVYKGYQFLQRFQYAYSPIYKYQVEDVWLTKEIYMPYGKNAVLIKTTIETGSNSVTLNSTPEFNGRSHGGSVNDEPFKIKVTDSMNHRISLDYHLEAVNEHLTLQFQYNEGKVHLYNHPKTTSNIHLDIEEATGMNPLDSTVALLSHQLEIPAHTTKTLYCYFDIEDEATESTNFTSKCESIISDYNKRYDAMIKNSGIQSTLGQRLVVSSDQFIANRHSTGLKTILAGLPWFADWARDTMIAVHGLTITTKQYDICKEILLSFAKYEKNGIIPNMFPDEDTEPLYNTVDGPLWYFQAIYEYYQVTKDKELVKELFSTLETIVDAFRRGTDFSIHMDKDGLIHAGSGLDQVTWMDVRINGIVVTPRHGKPVEINALWFNALNIMDIFRQDIYEIDTQYDDLIHQVQDSFSSKFWNDKENCLYDVVDSCTENNSLTQDDDVRCNQIWAISLPFTMLTPAKEKQVVDKVFKELYATYGLRSLSPQNKQYKPYYQGELIDRDFAYHQGTVWTFPLGAFITAYRKVYQNAPNIADKIKAFILPFEDHIRDGCIGSIAEIFDGNGPNISRGCYAQAWSVGEILRVIGEEENLV